jgi:hypothetical protein
MGKDLAAASKISKTRRIVVHRKTPSVVFQNIYEEIYKPVLNSVLINRLQFKDLKGGARIQPK